MFNLLKQSVALVGVVKALRQIPFDVKRALWCLGRDADIREYLDSHAVRKLQIGAGYNLGRVCKGRQKGEALREESRVSSVACRSLLPSCSPYKISSQLLVANHPWFRAPLAG